MMGIGTPSPSSKLFVQGGEIGTDGNLRLFGSEPYIYTNGFIKPLRVEASSVILQGHGGNVGIGALSPSEKLEVTGNIKATAFIGDGSQLTAIPYWTKDANGDIASNSSSGVVKIGRPLPSWSGSDWSGLYINYNSTGQHMLRGKLIINDVPTMVGGGIEVHGGISATDDIISEGRISAGSYVSASGTIAAGGTISAGGTIYSQSDPSYGQTYLRTWGLLGNGDIYIQPGYGYNLYLRDQGANTGMLNIKFGKTIFEAGSVGIGCTDTKGYMLAVNGPMVATKVMVKLQADWPDYVFSSNYKLKSLTEIESYIKEYKHLPDVPTQQDVKEGVDVAEMNRILLKKIEEMTLLMIEQGKRIEQLEKNNK